MRTLPKEHCSENKKAHEKTITSAFAVSNNFNKDFSLEISLAEPSLYHI